ncbi:MAG TPA: helix-turn-helix domain-containing protein [Polyangiaceae bacterium]
MNLRGGRLLTATQVARMCGVDIKTIHNWVGKGRIRGHRTGGRHLRFWPLDVIDFLRAWELGIPEALRSARLRVLVVDKDPAALAASKRSLSRRFDVATADDVVDAIVTAATSRPDVLVVGDVAPLGLDDLARGLGSSDSTRHVRVVPRGDPAKLREALERLQGG